jgi:hypothetical protein
MTIRADVEDIQTTRTEKFLAVVFTAFLLLGGVWTYTRIDDLVRDHVEIPQATFEPNDPAIVREATAQQRLIAAQARASQSFQDLEVRREAYRTALDAGETAPELRRRYEATQAAYNDARRELARARAEAQAAAPAAAAARREAQESVEAALDRQARYSFFARFGLVIASIGFAYWFLAYMRRRTSRWFPLALSVVAFATIFAFVLASDYMTDYFDPFQWGLAILALLGIGATLLAYLALQRYLIRRLPQRRVRKRQCPFCGYPASTNARCEGCGREVVAPCSSCEAPRRVGTAHCGICGATS